MRPDGTCDLILRRVYMDTIISIAPSSQAHSPKKEIVPGDKVATRWTAEGTNNGALGPVPATGRRMRITGLILDRVVGGKVVERWEQWDQMGLLQQLGLAAQ